MVIKRKPVHFRKILLICNYLPIYFSYKSSCFLRRPQKLTKLSIWRLLHTVKLTVKIFSIFVAFSENVNFNIQVIFYKINAATVFLQSNQNLKTDGHFICTFFTQSFGWMENSNVTLSWKKIARVDRIKSNQ
jgi:hypothetical protein